MNNKNAEIIKILEQIIVEINYYKNLKNYNTIIDTIKNTLYNEKNFTYQILSNVINDLKNNKIETSKLDSTKINNLIKKIWSFQIDNEKNFIKKIADNKWTIYEYETYYIIYLNNKKINIKEEIQKTFPNMEITSIAIDNIIRKNYTIDDIKMSERVRIKINK